MNTRDLIRHIVTPKLKKAKHYYIRKPFQAFKKVKTGVNKSGKPAYKKVPVESIGIPKVTVVIVEDMHGDFARGVSMCNDTMDNISREKGVKRAAGRANAALLNYADPKAKTANTRKFNPHAAKILSTFHNDNFEFGSELLTFDGLTSFEKQIMEDKSEKSD